MYTTHTGRELKFDGKTFAPISSSYCVDEVIALARLVNAKGKDVDARAKVAAWEALRAMAGNKVFVSNVKAQGALDELLGLTQPKWVRGKGQLAKYNAGAERARELLAA